MWLTLLACQNNNKESVDRSWDKIKDEFIDGS